jgi:hypothetical protein
MKLVFVVVMVMVILLVYKRKSSFTSINTIHGIYNRKTFTETQGKKLDGIDMIYAIAMPSRLSHIQNELKMFNVKYLDAVKPEDLSEDEVNELSTVNQRGSYMYNKITRLCVILSFTMCYLDALKKGYRTIAVFEDDILTKVPLDLVNKGTLEFSKSDIDFFYMGYCFMNCRQPLDKNKYEYIIPLTDPTILCGHATAIKTKALQGIIDYSFPMKKPSDETYWDYFVKNKSKLAIPKVPYFDQITRDKMASLNESTVELKYCR